MPQAPNSTTSRLLIYGATGSTGTLLSHRAKAAGLAFDIAGRDADKVAALALELGVPYHVFAVDEAAGWQRALVDKACLLNAAGPFSATAAQAMEACLTHRVHYLDITAEVDIYRLAETKNEAALAAGIMVLSGAGLFVSYDPLALHTARRVPNPVKLRMAFRYTGGFTPGSVASSANIIAAGLLVRQNGELVKLAEAPAQPFDFGDGPQDSSLTPLGGVVLCWKSTGIPNIEEYFHMQPLAASGATANAADEPGAGRNKILAEVTDADGTVVRSLVDSPPGYLLTVESAIVVAQQVLKGSFKTGFQSPASAYGEELIGLLPDTHIIDL
jgi:short subunit dehydrogenase-like uncharacterized protein